MLSSNSSLKETFSYNELTSIIASGLREMPIPEKVTEENKKRLFQLITTAAKNNRIYVHLKATCPRTFTNEKAFGILDIIEITMLAFTTFINEIHEELEEEDVFQEFEEKQFDISPYVHLTSSILAMFIPTNDVFSQINARISRHDTRN